jgi:hypothetical protein
MSNDVPCDQTLNLEILEGIELTEEECELVGFFQS